MANASLNGGFKPVRMRNGTPLPEIEIRETANNYGTALYQGDILIPVSDGTVAIAAAANDGLLAYVATGFSYVINGKRERRPYLPANTTFSPTSVGSPTAPWVECMPLHPDLVLMVDGDAAAPTPTVAGVVGLIGEDCDLVTGTGDNTSGQSGMTLGLSTHSTTVGNFRIVGVVGYPEGQFLGNDVTSSRAKFYVITNEGFFPPYRIAGV
jgi:hypothetical protein